METTAWITLISLTVGIVGSLCGIYFGSKNSRRTDKTDNNAEGVKYGTMLSDIGYIKSGVDDIKQKQKEQDRQHLEVVTRLTAVEESSKQAHKRIDGLEDKINH